MQYPSRCFGFFFDFRKRLFESYSFLFTQSGGKQEFQTSRSIDWGWYHFLMALANNNVFDLERAEQLPIHKALMFLTYRKEQEEKAIKGLKR